ncbi:MULTISPECIES: hypothetical protein [unclassified Pseudomonas]|uniref:hypothetical protein n=1 Tax=unclassified Pseudomonas TaxID=196821 RepID=UPI001911F1EB|nr:MULTISPECIES: hypothetical protein [unclassified Pseudomonas]MBK5553905.1 hypothetical protein [Pseudomonas sp. TH03]MEB0225007.1 hypothetical protein [Pseudomonas sp. 5S1]MEB0296161.1 hypothetical protein [Pseudomonas sp. 10S4]WPX16566.1 hypothetical protein RHM58_21440 [Pseudomonas sp. 10S4]
MNPAPLITTPKLLTVAAVVELATGVALLLTPGIVSNVLLGIVGTDVTNLFARFFGIALIALGIACWPRPISVGAVRAMQVYNGAIALYLAYVGVFVSSGLLLWPAVVFHSVMTLLLLRR